MWPRVCAAALILLAGSAGGYALRPHFESPRSAHTARVASGPRAPAREVVRILTTNVVVFVLLLAGAVTGGLSTVAVLMTSGFALGSVAGAALDAGTPVTTLLALLLPHGIPEVAALLMGGAVGLGGLRTWVMEREGGVQGVGLTRLLASAVCLLCYAAVIEATFTPWLASKV